MEDLTVMLLVVTLVFCVVAFLSWYLHIYVRTSRTSEDREETHTTDLDCFEKSQKRAAIAQDKVTITHSRLY